MGDTEKRITAKMVLDSTGFNNGLKGVNSSLKQAQSELKLASSGIQAFGKNSEKLKSVQEALSKQVELHAKKVDIYKQSLEKTTSKMQDNIKEREKLKESLSKADAELKKVIDSGNKEVQVYAKNREELTKLNKQYNDSIKKYGENSKEAEKLKEQIVKLENEQKKLIDSSEKECKAYEKTKEEVEKLENEYKKKEKAVESNAKQINNYNTNMNKASAEMNKAQGELNKLNKQLAESDSKWLSASKNLEKSGKKLQDIGGKVSGVGDNILKLSAPFAAAGIASAKFSMDFGDSVAKVSTISDESEVSIGDLRKGILKLSDDTGIASTAIAEDVYNAISAGQKTGDAINFVTESTKLAKAGFADSGQALDLLTTIMNGYKMKAEDVTKVSDILITTQNLGKVTTGELSESMGKIIKTADVSSVSLEQVAAGYAVMTANGIKSAESTTYMSSMLNELTKNGTIASKQLKASTGKTFEQLMKSGKSLGDVLSDMSNYAKKNGKSLQDMLGSADAGKAGLILADNAGKDFNKMLEGMNTSLGATDSAFEKVSNTSGERLKKNLNKLKNEGIRLGDALAPVLEKGIELIGTITDKISGMSDEQLQNYAKWGMIAIASGGALKVLGGGISTLGSIATGFSKVTGILGKAKVATDAVGVAGELAGGAGGLGALSGGLGAVGSIALPVTLAIAAVGASIYVAYENTKFLGESCGKSAEEMGTMEKALALANGTIVHTNEQLEEMNVKHKKWSDDVAPETQQALDNCSKKIAEYNMEVEGATHLDKIIDDEAGARLNTKLDDICNSAIEKIKARAPETQKEMAEAFKADDGKLDENEQKLIEFFNKSGEDQIKRVNELKEKINAIYKNAKDKNVAITKEEKEEIAKLTQEIGTVEMQNTVNSKQELFAAQADFNARMKNLDMQGLSELMTTKATARDDEINKVTLYYDKQIELLKLNQDSMSEEQKTACEAEITKLEEKKNEAVGKENEKYKGYLDAAIEKYPQLINYIDQKNGDMLNNQEQQKTLELNKYTSKMDGMLSITKTGYYKVKDSVTGSMHDCYVEVDSATGQINGVWDNTTKDIYGNPIKAKEEIDQELKDGQAFQPIADSYDTKKQDIWKNSIKVQSEQNWNLFDWVKGAWNGALSFIRDNPANTIASNYVGQKWTGDSHFQGGLTYMHEKGYELYDLPKSTRIYNHEASADLVMKTAEGVAEKVANRVLKGFNGGSENSNNAPILIQVPVVLEGREIARASAKYMSQELAYNNRGW